MDIWIHAWLDLIGFCFAEFFREAVLEIGLAEITISIIRKISFDRNTSLVCSDFYHISIFVDNKLVFVEYLVGAIIGS